MSGKVIVFEGTDGSGKSTQFRLLCQRMEADGIPFRRLIFPQYQEPSSALIRMYLGGEFGSHPSDVNPYAASTFYAVDRYASWKKVWGEYYRDGGLVLSDRYTTSNACLLYTSHRRHCPGLSQGQHRRLWGLRQQ